jgi:hypothetical protein
LKCISIKAFVLYLQSHALYKKFYRFFPHLIALEISLGVAIALKVAPFFILMATFFFILILTFFKVLDWFKFKNKTCNCYGVLFSLPNSISVLINITFLVISAYLFLKIDLSNAWEGRNAGLVLCSSYFFVFMGILVLYKQENLQLNFLNKGRMWNSKWIGNTNSSDKKVYYIFISADCDKCEEWIDKLRHWNVDASGQYELIFKKDAFSRDELLNLGLVDVKINEVSSFVFSLMVSFTPFAIEVENSVIINRYENSLPFFDES